MADDDRYVLEGKLADAESEFKKSLSLVSQERSCPVRINLEVVLEALGDLKNADQLRHQAKPLWIEALKVTQEAPGGCFDTTTEPDEERRKHLNETEQRLQDKLKDPPPSEGGGGGGGGGGDRSDEGQGEQGGQGGQGSQDQSSQGGQGGQNQSGQGGQGSAGQSGQGSGGGEGQPTPDTVGADRIATESGGAATHELNPGQGDPGDVLKRLLEDSNASGTDRE
ncbi:hypothetical protein GCM10009632_02630 [Mycolicibacterium alvei]|uniref:Uncharacterized protein n=1 Tax=Mycolicibacterium alvei TaxID=67081 RepID=A0A6N4UWD5_9MYCO|nr:hypothetical protein [Mycolicibacterium alvei]BBX27722.1 hypothetical protein MALV_28470 [Mycolicibacterium alvei]